MDRARSAQGRRPRAIGVHRTPDYDWVVDTDTGRRAGRMLLISPRFFGYERDIADAFERKGLSVDFVDERPTNNTVAKAVFRMRPGLLGRSIDRHYRRTLGRLSGDYDLVLVIKGEVVPAWFLDRVRALAPEAVFAFYTFDSLANSPHARSLMPLFHHRYSFQAEAEDPGFRLKHLFYGPEFRPLGTPDRRRYDVAFVGTLHSDRYRFVRRVLAGFRTAFVYFYSQAHWFFLLRRMTDARLRDVESADVHFEKLDRAAVADVFRNSLAVLDMQHDQQSGLTMRSFEVLASGAYLVTTNPAAWALSNERVIVVPAEPSEQDVADLVHRLRSRPVPTAAPEGFERHSVDAWVEEFIKLTPQGAR